MSGTGILTIEKSTRSELLVSCRRRRKQKGRGQRQCGGKVLGRVATMPIPVAVRVMMLKGRAVFVIVCGRFMLLVDMCEVEGSRRVKRSRLRDPCGLSLVDKHVQARQQQERRQRGNQADDPCDSVVRDVMLRLQRNDPPPACGRAVRLALEIIRMDAANRSSICVVDGRAGQLRAMSQNPAACSTAMSWRA